MKTHCIMVSWIVLLVSIGTFKSNAQTVKYDDLFVLLTAKKYDVAEPFLKKYVNQTQNNANAYLYLGIIYQEKGRNAEDPLEEMSYLDSALFYYNMTNNYLTVSHLKANEKYYSMYSRRDLRTGEFGIKYEDIRLDIDTRKSAVMSKLLTLCRSNALENSPGKVSVEIATTKKVLNPSGKYYALIIGVSDYDNYKLNLERPAADAAKLATLLYTHYDFDSVNVSLLVNPMRQQILNELFNYRKKLTTKDNLLIFYAGHGMFDEDAQQGYWWPRDADSESPSNWLSNNDLRDQIRGIKTAHTLLIADACFSGGIFRMRGTNNLKNASYDIVSLYKLTSRRAITSGAMTTVPDQSVFFDYFLKTLKDNKSNYLSSQKLFDSFRSNVINNTLQVPQDGIISETGDEGGDFIFIKRN